MARIMAVDAGSIQDLAIWDNALGSRRGANVFGALLAWRLLLDVALENVNSKRHRSLRPVDMPRHHDFAIGSEVGRRGEKTLHLLVA